MIMTVFIKSKKIFENMGEQVIQISERENYDLVILNLGYIH